MDKELVDIVLEKSFVELSENERKEIREWCSSEEEFDQLKQVFIEVELMKKNETATVHPDKKRNLDAMFIEKHRQIPAFWSNSIVVALYPIEKPFQRRPLVQVAALALLFFLTYPMYQKAEDGLVEPKYAKNEEVKSTTSPKENTPSLKVNAIEKVTKKEQLMSVKPSKEESSFEGVEVSISSSLLEGSSPSVASNHPDGIFNTENSSVNYSVPVSENPDFLDLLTATF